MKSAIVTNFSPRAEAGCLWKVSVWTESVGLPWVSFSFFLFLRDLNIRRWQIVQIAYSSNPTVMWGWCGSISKSLLCWIRSASREGRWVPQLPHAANFPLSACYHEETERQDARPHHQHPHLPGGRGGRLRDPGVQTGEKSQEEAGRQEVRTHAQI